MESADPRRITAFLDALAGIGVDESGGWSRLAYSPAERAAHRLFRGTLDGYGLHTWSDAVGNSFGELAGAADGPRERTPRRRLATGSHLDTVYQGGNFDGAAGVAAAVEAARLLASGERLAHPLRVVAFAAEEGARFGTPCIGSRLMTGAFSPADLGRMTDSGGRSAYDCAREVGLDPDAYVAGEWTADQIACFLEVHIEQGRVLEQCGLPIGVVTTISGSSRHELMFTGRADHSGATPMELRFDALAAAAEFVLAVESHARGRETTVATVGRIEAFPNSLTTVPGRVVLALDVRDIYAAQQEASACELLAEAARICADREVSLNVRGLSDQSPVMLDERVRTVLERTADDLGLAHRVMPSGASHDSAHIATRIPTGMIFLPCADGISHSPAEHADPADIARAVDLLVAALRALDASRAGS